MRFRENQIQDESAPDPERFDNVTVKVALSEKKVGKNIII